MINCSLKVGDRVRVYGRQWEWHSHPASFVGTVEEVDSYGMPLIQPDGDSQVKYWCHPKQCRRLKKREPLRIKLKLRDGLKWAVEHVGGRAHTWTVGDEIEFVEVRKSK